MTDTTLLALHRQRIVALEAEVARLRGIEARARAERAASKALFDGDRWVGYASQMAVLDRVLDTQGEG